MMNNFMNGMFGKIGSGMCKLSMSGNIAVKTSNGYKSYNVKSGKLTNCGNAAAENNEPVVVSSTVISAETDESGAIIW